MNRADLTMIARIIFLLCLIFSGLVGTTVLADSSRVYIPTREELRQGAVEIIAGEEKTIYEYRVAGRLLAIKVIPAIGPAYYMVPADGTAHYKSLDQSETLYPKWVLFEW